MAAARPRPQHTACGRLGVELCANTTHHLIRDIELLRQQLGIDRWLVLGGSWGATLGRSYAEAYPGHVTELVLFGVVLHGRLDVSGPPDIAWHLAQAWPDAELHLIDDAGHGSGHPGMSETVVAALDRIAALSIDR